MITQHDKAVIILAQMQTEVANLQKSIDEMADARKEFLTKLEKHGQKAKAANDAR